MQSFLNLGLDEDLLKAVQQMGFETPSEIQSKAIPQLLEKETDLVALAQTGTGKTAAFGLPMLQKIDPSTKTTQGLILSPTRELCLQITNEIEQYGSELKQINSNTLENWGLNKFQRAFHIKHNQAGGRCFILVNRHTQSDLKLLRLGAGGYSHILTQPKTRDGLQKILTAIKTYKN